jgi:hypothetical protein
MLSTNYQETDNNYLLKIKKNNNKKSKKYYYKKNNIYHPDYNPQGTKEGRKFKKPITFTVQNIEKDFNDLLCQNKTLTKYELHEAILNLRVRVLSCIKLNIKN